MHDPNAIVAWAAMFVGALSGAAFGLRFDRDRWLGGYGSWPRRMLRLGHIAFFGVAFLNLALAVSAGPLRWPIGPSARRSRGQCPHARRLLSCRLAQTAPPSVRAAGGLDPLCPGGRALLEIMDMNIAMIAMSGIRACDAELLSLGLTLPGFVERSKVIAALPSLGLLTLAGMTPREHSVHYFEVADLAAADELPSDFDLVVVSTFSAQAKEGLALAGRFASSGIPTIMGGLHVTSCPDEPAEMGVSAAVGEGEIIWPAILADAARGKLAPRYDARGHEFDMARSPMPAFELLDISRYNRLTVQTSRGCPWRCSFCASSILLTARYKQKPIDMVLAEIDAIRNLWPRPFIEFADDNAFVHRAWWREFLPKLAQARRQVVCRDRSFRRGGR